MCFLFSDLPWTLLSSYSSNPHIFILHPFNTVSSPYYSSVILHAFNTVSSPYYRSVILHPFNTVSSPYSVSSFIPSTLYPLPTIAESSFIHLALYPLPIIVYQYHPSSLHHFKWLYQSSHILWYSLFSHSSSTSSLAQSSKNPLPWMKNESWDSRKIYKIYN